MSPSLRLRLLGGTEAHHLQASPAPLPLLLPLLVPHMKRWVLALDAEGMEPSLRGAGAELERPLPGVLALRREALGPAAPALAGRFLLADASALTAVAREPRVAVAFLASARSGLPSPPRAWGGNVAAVVRGETVALGMRSRGLMMSVAGLLVWRLLGSALETRGVTGIREPSPLLMERVAQKSAGAPVILDAATLEITPVRVRIPLGERWVLAYGRDEEVWEVEAA